MGESTGMEWNMIGRAWYWFVTRVLRRRQVCVYLKGGQTVVVFRPRNKSVKAMYDDYRSWWTLGRLIQVDSGRRMVLLSMNEIQGVDIR